MYPCLGFYSHKRLCHSETMQVLKANDLLQYSLRADVSYFLKRKREPLFRVRKEIGGLHAGYFNTIIRAKKKITTCNFKLQESICIQHDGFSKQCCMLIRQNANNHFSIKRHTENIKYSNVQVLNENVHSFRLLYRLKL